MSAPTHAGLCPNMASAACSGVMFGPLCAHDAAQGPAIALTGWSLSHGLANLMLDGVIDGLRLAALDVDTMPRRLAKLVIAVAPKARLHR
ncbi:MAG: hypothetical protein ABL985_20740 [Casimicrobium sp.]